MAAEFVPLVDRNEDMTTQHVPQVKDDLPFKQLLGKWKLNGRDKDVRLPRIQNRKESELMFVKVQGHEALMCYFVPEKDDPLDPVEIPALRLENTSFTVTLWFRASYMFDYPVMLLTDSGDARQFSIACRNRRITVELKGTSSESLLSIMGSELDTKKWVHVAFVWNRESRTGELFYDGQSVAMETSTCDEDHLDLCPVMVQTFQVMRCLKPESEENQEVKITDPYGKPEIGLRDMMIFGCAFAKEQVAGAIAFCDDLMEIASINPVPKKNAVVTVKLRCWNEDNLDSDGEAFFDSHEICLEDYGQHEESWDWHFWAEVPTAIGLQSFTISFIYDRPRVWTILSEKVHVFSESSADHHYRLTVDKEGYVAAAVYLPQQDDFAVTYKSDRPLNDCSALVSFTWDHRHRKGCLCVRGDDVSSPPIPTVHDLDDRCFQLHRDRNQNVTIIEQYKKHNIFSADAFCIEDVKLYHGVFDEEDMVNTANQMSFNNALEYGSIDEIKEEVTPKNLCAFKNPMAKAFETQERIKELGRTKFSWTKQTCDELAESVEQFAVDFIDQIEGEKSLEMVDETIQEAIFYEQKKFLGQSYIHRLVTEQWSDGDSFSTLQTMFVLLFVAIETVLLPLHFPLIFICCTEPYFDDYSSSPLVRFMRELLSHFAFVGLHIALCLSPTTVSPSALEYVIFVFFIGRILGEVQQYQRSRSKVYFRDMWNYLDIIIIVLYFTIFVVRIVTMAKSGNIRSNNLLAAVMYLYGVNTLFLILRMSSFLELNKTTGPLQLALMRMLLDLWIVLVQFIVVIVAFSLAITKVYFAQRSLELGQAPVNVTDPGLFCPDDDGAQCFLKTTESLFWSVFGLTDLSDMRTSNGSASSVVLYLYAVFLILCVIMLVNTLVALLNNTYAEIAENSDSEWKFTRTLYADQYNRCHPFPPPINLVTVPVGWLCTRLQRYLIARKETLVTSNNALVELVMRNVAGVSISKDAINRVFLRRKAIRMDLKWKYDYVYWRNTKSRYLQKFGDQFPSTGDDKLDAVQEELLDTRERITRSLVANLANPTSSTEMWRTSGGMLVYRSLLSRAASSSPVHHFSGCPGYLKGIPDAWALAHYMAPLTEEAPSFEVFIQSVDDHDIDMSIGVVPEGYPMCENAGVIAGSVAFFTKDSGAIMSGRSYDEVHGDAQKIEDGVQVKRDDVIRCALDFSCQSDWGVPISFSVNGRHIWRAMIYYKHGEVTSFYPRIGIKSLGLSVIFKVPLTSSATAANFPLPSRSVSFPNTLDVQSPSVMAGIESRLESMDRKMEKIRAESEKKFEKIHAMLASILYNMSQGKPSQTTGSAEVARHEPTAQLREPAEREVPDVTPSDAALYTSSL